VSQRQDKFVLRGLRHPEDYPVVEKELKPELLEAACAEAGIPLTLTLRRQAGYDHSYYFISTFMADHARYAKRLSP